MDQSIDECLSVAATLVARAVSSDVLLAAVRELAGPDPKLFPSAALVVNTLKVIQTLEQIGEQLQVRPLSITHSISRSVNTPSILCL